MNNVSFTILLLLSIDLNTRWTQYKTDCKLSNRLSNVFDWKDALARTLADTEQEINALMTVKRMAEYALEAKTLPFEVVLNCLQTRQNRIGIDSVRDNVESELHKVCTLKKYIPV